MKLPFFDRTEERRRLKRLLKRKEGNLGVLFGRRRCGKSRLLQEVLPSNTSVYYLADDREGPLQRAALAKEIARKIPGFDDVVYPDWDALLDRWWGQARPGWMLAIDEFPALVAHAKELPSILQKYVDRRSGKGVHLLLCGSSQRMMQGLVLDHSAPLYGRAGEILKISPLPAGWIQEALPLRSSAKAVEAYAVWGGVPRYWELAADFPTLKDAIRELILDSLGVLHQEPQRLLLDDSRDIAQAASILSLIGQGCHRPSEIAGRLGKPATSMSRPLQRLLELDLIRRDIPFSTSIRDTKKTLYRIADPFLRFWFRFVEGNRTRLEAGQVRGVADEVADIFPAHVAGIWEDLARSSVASGKWLEKKWKPASSWWGAGLDRKPMEIDLLAESTDGKAILIGEVKWTTGQSATGISQELKSKAERCPLIRDRKIFQALWLKTKPRRLPRDTAVFAPDDVMAALR